VLTARVSGRPLPEFPAGRLFELLDMADTGLGCRQTISAYSPATTGSARVGLELVDPGERWSSLSASPPERPSGPDYWHYFARMLLVGGSADGRRLPSAAPVQLMTSSQLSQSQRDGSQLSLQGQGLRSGGSVDVEVSNSSNVPGRHGCDGTERQRISSRPPARSPSCSPSRNWPDRPSPP